MVPPSRPSLLRDALSTLPAVRVRKLFGSDAFFAGERMFAVLGVNALVLRLPEPARTATLQNGSARPFLSEHLTSSQGWVEVPYHIEFAHLVELGQTAHIAALRSRKPARRKFRRAAHRRKTRS
jgi:TfoX/Sxy family transcriptional regulator of competence genes